MPQPQMDPVRVLASCFALSALGGFCALLRSTRPLTWRIVIAATCYPGALGLIIGLLGYSYSEGKDFLYVLIGLAGLAGLGGATLCDFILKAMAQGGVNVKIMPGPDDDHDRRDRRDPDPPPPPPPPPSLKSSGIRSTSAHNPDVEPGRGSSVWIDLN